MDLTLLMNRIAVFNMLTHVLQAIDFGSCHKMLIMYENTEILEYVSDGELSNCWVRVNNVFYN